MSTSGVKVGVVWTGDALTWPTKMMGRAQAAEFRREVIRPWKVGAMQRRIDMYMARGATEEQGPWRPNSKWTAAAKGHDRPMLSGRLFQFGAMVRSYVIDVRQAGAATFEFTLSNRARSKDGFDYPSLLHQGGRRGRFLVRPRPGKKALRLTLPDGKVIFRASTRPRRVKARPHIIWMEQDLLDFNRRGLDWLVDGKTDDRRTG